MTRHREMDPCTVTAVAERFLQSIQTESLTWEGEGRDAWAALSRLGGAALKENDAEIIARRLYEAFPAFKAKLKRDGVGLGVFCQQAGLGRAEHYSKELHRMLLPPGKVAQQRGLRRAASKYRKLLKAMSSVTGESTSSLATRLLAGTTLHPANAPIRNEIEQVQLVLQSMVDAVDTEFGLYKTFMETARLKSNYAAEGRDCRWPHYEADFRIDLFEPTESYVVLEDTYLEDSAATMEKKREAAKKERESATDISRAYWERPVSRRNKDFASWLIADHTGGGPSGCLQNDEFFFVPHCYLGYGEWSPTSEDSIATRHIWMPKLRDSVLTIYSKFGHQVADEWNETDLCPKGQTTSWPESYGDCQWNGWIVIYPTPDNSRLMPMLYVPGEEGGAILVPLDMITLSALRFSYYVSPSGEVETFYERIKNLIGFRPGESKVMLDSFRRTAPWLEHNPIMKLARQQARDQELMRAFSMQLLHEQIGGSTYDTSGKRQTGNEQQTLQDGEQ